jgi:hypothetical protein
MIKKNLIFCFFLTVITQASGPALPEGYRMPNSEELSLPMRDIDKYRYKMAVGDFNGDSLVDGVILSIDKDNKELAVLVFLCTNNDQVYKWYKVESMEYDQIKYTGLRLLKPQNIYYYTDIRKETKTELSLNNESFELFQFEGSSSVFYYSKKSDHFERVWISK